MDFVSVDSIDLSKVVITDAITGEVIKNVFAAPKPYQEPTLETLLTNVFDEVRRVKEKFGEEAVVNYDECLSSVIRRMHCWPQLQVKKFFDKSGLTLLHNTYKRSNVSHFDRLYNECRSVVLDLNAPVGKNVILSLSNNIPERLTVDAYRVLQLPTDRCEMSFEGTTVAVYYHESTTNAEKSGWKFGTTSCPTIDSSRYFHPTKTHGNMLDEVLSEMFPGVEEPRTEFTNSLNKSYTYTFILVHHENGHLSDHSDIFGQKEYKALVHIGTRNRDSMEALDIGLEENRLAVNGMNYARVFSSPKDAIEWLNSSDTVHTNGFIVKRANGTLVKISSADMMIREEENLGHPNPWHNMMWVYCKNNPLYKVDTYMRKYLPKGSVKPVYYNGVRMSPTFIIHTGVCVMRDYLLQAYHNTTTYNVYTKRYTINKELDAQMSTIVRFHLAQLRFIQISTHTHKPLDAKAIYHYLCIHNSMKNKRLLINYFAKSGHMIGVPDQPLECLKVLDSNL
jgi:hypothetical protein